MTEASKKFGLWSKVHIDAWINLERDDDPTAEIWMENECEEMNKDEALDMIIHLKKLFHIGATEIKELEGTPWEDEG